MKPNRKFIVATLFAAGVFAALSAGVGIVSAAAAAQASGMPETERHGRGPEGIFGKLGLSADQQQSVDTLLAAKRPDIKNVHGQMRANSLKLRQTKPDDPNYAAVVAEVSQANAALLTQQITLQSDIRAQIYALLTPAQRTQLAALEANMQSRMHEHGRHWGHRTSPEADGL